MKCRWKGALCVAAATALVGCASSSASGSGSRGSEPAESNRSTNAIVLSEDQLNSGATNLLSVLRNRIVGMHVEQSGTCPTVILRGRKSMFGGNSPIIYVNGARAANTCILDMLEPAEVARVEVYPQGIAHRAGYESHANGLILVFLQTAEM